MRFKNTFSGKQNMSELRMRKFWLMAFAIVMSFAISAPLVRAADDKEKGATPLEDEMIAGYRRAKTSRRRLPMRRKISHRFN